MARYFVVFLLVLSLLSGCGEQTPAPPAVPETKPAPAAPRITPEEKPPVPAVAELPAPPVPERKEPAETSAVYSVPRIFMGEPMTAQLVELPTNALATWRSLRAQKPTLLLVSNNPFLVPAPAALQAKITNLLEQGTPGQIATRSLPYHPDPLLLPSMAVDAALRQGWFEKIVWTVPMSTPDQPLSLEIFRKQLADNRMAKQAEIDSFQLDGNVVKGALREVPVSAATLPHLPEINGPVVVHVDLSYFGPLYKNEISTPLLPIVASTFKALQARKLQVLAVTVSRGNLDRSLPLDVRFLGDIVKELIKTPALLDQPLSDHWQRKANTLYLEHLFQKEKVRETLLEMELESPKDASVKFALYRINSQFQNEGTKALGYLEKAVRLDKTYGLEYLALADLAYERKFPGEALRMLSLAAKVFPDNPLIKLQLAQLADELGDRKTAQHLAGQLQKLSWSTVYYPNRSKEIDEFINTLKQPRPQAGNVSQAPRQ